jgi:ribonuclease P protein component
VQEGKRIRTRYIEVRAAASPLAHSEATLPGVRVGLVVPRFKHSAVLRNHLKRRLRELARLRLVPLAMRADVVMKVRPDAYAATFAALAQDVAQVLEQLERWHVSSPDAVISSEPSIDRPRRTS